MADEPDVLKVSIKRGEKLYIHGDMVERVRSAIFDRMAIDEFDEQAIARAAIEAMREPSETMLEAGSHPLCICEEASLYGADTLADKAWQAMISAALSPEGVSESR